MYNQNKMAKSQIKSVEVVEGETIETKIERLLENKEAIKDSVPMIYTERKEGVGKGYNIRTDRFEEAIDKMDMLNRSITAKRNSRIEEESIKESGKVNEIESTQGKEVNTTKG